MTRVGVAQIGSVLYDIPATLTRMEHLCTRAASEGVEFLVFPEAFVGGYPKGITFGATVGSRTAEGREEFHRYFESAIVIPGPETERMGAMARAMNAWLVVGVIERAGTTLYCSALSISPDGTIAGKHRKLMPTAAERLIWGFGDGSTIATMDSPHGRFAATICWENYMPQLRQAMYAQGIELWCAPTVDDRDIWQASMRHIAYEGRCFVLSACQFFTRADCPADYTPVQGNDPGTVLIRGGSVIVSPLGEILAGPVYGKEALLTAEIDRADIARGKFDLDTVGHYARPDIFQLSVNITPQNAVTFGGDALSHPAIEP
ncbi:MAG: nitrilase-related carbon-nitrogen hydrolase [Thermomicrobiales bacterium]